MTNMRSLHQQVLLLLLITSDVVSAVQTNSTDTSMTTTTAVTSALDTDTTPTTPASDDVDSRKSLHVMHICNEYLTGQRVRHLAIMVNFAVDMINKRTDILGGHKLVVHLGKVNGVSTGLTASSCTCMASMQT